jgi:hypothetical protein
MYPKLSSDEYSYTFSAAEKHGTLGINITLTQASTGNTKVFFQVGQTSDIPSFVSHMNSLTDDQCAQWFNVREPKKKQN